MSEHHFNYREVEDFARRLNSSWVLSSGQERQPVHFSINGNGATRRLTGTHDKPFCQAFQVMLGSLILLMVFGWQVPEFCGVTRKVIMHSPSSPHWWISTVKGNSRVRISGLTGTEGGDEWFDLSNIILDEASDLPKFDNVPANREELVRDDSTQAAERAYNRVERALTSIHSKLPYIDKLNVTSLRGVLGDQDGFSRPQFLHLPANLITTNVKFERGKKKQVRKQQHKRLKPKRTQYVE
ncbi:hypothetical protein F2Q69_00049639 [Brassica cretica]|uniref:Uncharacterized protein n=1 Tax=Brassica cretica TaxID=69181 RepID=A0A8S9PSY1_BRACR|nr:hypothetical protein F2Q69_00049639 [Brassica cretica]